MGMSGISKSQVSRLCGEIDDKVQTFLNRLLEGACPYFWLDATYLKVREAGRLVSVAVIIAVGDMTMAGASCWRRHRPDESRDCLDRIPAQARKTRPARRQAWSRMPMKGRRRRSPRTPPGSAAVWISCATCSPMPDARGAASSPLSSPPPLRKKTPRPRERYGAKSPKLAALRVVYQLAKKSS
jgi:hypothetical protein